MEKKNLLKFGSHPPLDPDLGNFLKDSSTVRDRASFHTLNFFNTGLMKIDIAPLFGKTDWIFMEILPQIYLWTRKSPLSFESHLDSWQRSAFLECSCFKSSLNVSGL